MKNSIDMILEAIVQNILDEEAVTIGHMSTADGLALLVVDDGDIKRYVLWNPNRYFEITKSKGKVYEEDIAEVIYGYLKISKMTECDMWSVKTSAARKGYGPGIYDLAMGDIHPEYMSADRMSVSAAARKVWTYMFLNRANEIERIPVPEGEDCAALPYLPEEDEEEGLVHPDSDLHLSFAYAMKSNTQAETEQLKQANAKVFQQEQVPGNIKSQVLMLAGTFFSKMYWRES